MTNIGGSFKNELRILGHLLLLIGSLTMWNSAHASGCVVDSDEKIQIQISPATQSWGDYSGNQLIPSTLVDKCEKDSGRFLMISLGSAFWDTTNTGLNTSIFGDHAARNCRINNSQNLGEFKRDPATESLQRQYKFIRSCFDVRVVDVGGEPLIAKENQEFCQIKREDDGALTLSGDMCFLKIRARNKFAVQPVFKRKCLDPAYLQELGVEPQDMYAKLNTLVAGDDTGNSEDLTHIGSRLLHLNIAPSSKLLNLTEDFGLMTPRFVTDYSVDSDIAGIELKQQSDLAELQLKFLVSNLAQKKCAGAQCASISNYTQPFFGQIELYNLGKNRQTLVDEWWDGGLVPPNWQGLVPGMKFRLSEGSLREGGRYRLIVTFQNPTDDYAIFLSGFKQMLLAMYDTEEAQVGIDIFPNISSLSNLGNLPSFGGLGSLVRHNQGVALGEVVRGLDGIIQSQIWPPYYERVCNDQISCTKVGNKKFHQKFIIDFVVGGVDMETGAQILRDVSISKRSVLGGNYDNKTSGFASLTCER
ncbi:hypothetical protein EZJ49_06910 [Bdellovibrio bacteriovorus]|uniref:hypothetical protein n=1 Tax=Bdellovibrio bacteriovorus TaxID=959 RepID=UPI0021CFC713|nr:hypothetical protein [Bdellovibrio bacteriovorus]UXR65976.1 hypothetical protein EZJ49_06910 [Bdellovibrio bacteriovorus]